MDKSQAFRDDLAAQRVAIFGYDPAAHASGDDEIELPSWLKIVPAGPALTFGDFCGITAMATKNAQPAPEPILSIAGEQGTAAEFAAALQLVKARAAAPVKETPRGLLCMPETFDHRLGAWGR